MVSGSMVEWRSNGFGLSVKREEGDREIQEGGARARTRNESSLRDSTSGNEAMVDVIIERDRGQIYREDLGMGVQDYGHVKSTTHLLALQGKDYRISGRCMAREDKIA